MFKRYKIRVKATESERPWVLYFYVGSRKTRNGFAHVATVHGILPKKDKPEYGVFPDAEQKARRHRVNYCNRTWESWSGQECLKELWEKIVSYENTDTARLPKRNPFESDVEPEYDNLPEPDEVFRDC